MGRPSNTAERRLEILGGFLAALAHKGYVGATNKEVGKAAGLSPGLIHYHFKNKAEMLAALVDLLKGTLEVRIAARCQAAVDEPREQLFAWLDAHLALGPDADPDAVGAWTVIGAEAVRNPEVRELYTEAIRQRQRQLKALLLAVLRDEGRSGAGVTSMAAALSALIEGAFQIAAGAPDVLPSGYAADAARATAVALIEQQALR